MVPVADQIGGSLEDNVGYAFRETTRITTGENVAERITSNAGTGTVSGNRVTEGAGFVPRIGAANGETYLEIILEDEPPREIVYREPVNGSEGVADSLVREATRVEGEQPAAVGCGNAPAPFATSRATPSVWPWVSPSGSRGGRSP